MGIGSVLRSPYDWITQNFFRARTTQVKKRNTGCQEMAEACPAEITRDKILARYQGMALRIVLNADSRLLNQFFLPKTSVTKRCNFWWWFSAQNLTFWTLLPNERKYKVSWKL